MLENLEPTAVIKAPKDFRPGVQFDGTEGTATTEGMAEQPNFDDFLRERGYPPEEYEIIGTPRTSQWQHQLPVQFPQDSHDSRPPGAVRIGTQDKEAGG